jgi:hypothetical protein
MALPAASIGRLGKPSQVCHGSANIGERLRADAGVAGRVPGCRAGARGGAAGGAGTAFREGPAAPGADRRRGTVPGARGAGAQLVELPGDARGSLAGGRADRRQHAADAGGVGAGRAGGRAVRLRLRRHAARAGAGARQAAGAAVVRDLEEHRGELRAALGQDRRPPVSADALARRARALRAEPARRGNAGGRCARVRPADAAPEGDRPAAHGDHGAGRERGRQLPADARPRAGAGAAVRAADPG